MNDDLPKIYLWPNLMTAGNLCCGFFATLSIFSGMMHPELTGYFYNAIGLILGACVFDALDGRMARLTGQDSPFGREFDSLADIVSFGIAPALLVHEVVLRDMQGRWETVGWAISFIYLLCGAMRLARFNCIAIADIKSASSDFVGIPIPAAAGVISSLTLLLMWMSEQERSLGPWAKALPLLMLMLAAMMMSTIPYPSFKGLNVKTRRSMTWVVVAIMLAVVTVVWWEVMPCIFFLSYLIYGPLRPWISRKWRRELEEDDDVREQEERDEEALSAASVEGAEPSRAQTQDAAP
jgi:CDP-diacylglycerol---serine O-phosphatidyltransferase